jgi:hypothetical protein
MVNRIRWSVPAVCLLVVAVLVAACGRKTDPLTPDSPRPEMVRDLAVAVRDAVAYLTWSVPSKNVEGKDLPPDSVAEFQVYRAEIDRERKRPRFKLVATIDTADPAPARVRGGIVNWSDDGLSYGRVYAYRVRSRSVRGGDSPFSAEVRAAPLLALAPPGNVAAAAGDSAVSLTWDPVSRRSDGSAHEGFVGYNIYRGSEKGREDKKPLNSEPVRANSYRDTAVVNGKTYYYLVRSADSAEPPWTESLDSAEVTASPRDLTPPAPPAGLTVVPGIGRVFITWSENREQDLAGYHVYRATKSGGEARRLTDRPINRTTFSDEKVRQGMTYYYTITAVDKSGNESRRSNEHKTYTETIR